MVVAPGGEKRRLVTHPLRDVEAEHAVPEGERAVDIRHLQVGMTDVDARIQSHALSTMAAEERTGAAARSSSGRISEPPSHQRQ